MRLLQKWETEMRQGSPVLLKLFSVRVHNAHELFRIHGNKQSFSLGKVCVYREDTIHPSGSANSNLNETQPGPSRTDQQASFVLAGLQFPDLLSGVDPFTCESLRNPTVDLVVRSQAIRVLGSLEKMSTVSEEFFVGTHQRIPVLSKSKFRQKLETLTDAPHAAFVVLCLCICLVQQTPSEGGSMQTGLYVTVKNLISLLEATGPLLLDIVHCRILVTFYEIGHGLHSAAYVSIAACARTARALGIHKKPWLSQAVTADMTMKEETKRTWWAIVNIDRFINLCIGDALFVTDDPERSDPLPIEDLMWLEESASIDVDDLIARAPTLETPTDHRVGQMARESQILHLTGRVIHHVFKPTADSSFNVEEAIQLERTLKSFLPLLADEELRIGKYCGALMICARFVTPRPADSVCHGPN
jgi:hypothetical protein